MKRPGIISKLVRLALSTLLAVVVVAATSFWKAPPVSANHPVLVEGEQDFDGDGRTGTDEDKDGDDGIFGTIGAALGEANNGVNQNGRIVIVTSGRFLESIKITAANGNVQLEAAPGVDADIEAVRPDDTGNAERLKKPGIIVDAPSNRIVTIRNILSHNWSEGIQILGNSRVIIDGCRFDNNLNFGIHVMGNAKVTINNCRVTASGFRSSSVDTNPNPGVGISFEGQSSGTVGFTMVSGSFKAGLSNTTGNKKAVNILSVNVFDNNPDFEGIKPPKGSFPSVGGTQ